VETQEKFALLQQKAEQVGTDIKSDNPEVDTSYDIYVEDLMRRTYGLINMGEAYNQVFVWNVHFEQWEESSWDPYTIETMILKQRGSDV